VLRIELRAIPLANLEMGGVDVIELVIVLWGSEYRRSLVYGLNYYRLYFDVRDAKYVCVCACVCICVYIYHCAYSYYYQGNYLLRKSTKSIPGILIQHRAMSYFVMIATKVCRFAFIDGESYILRL
jgi:hypothetical protein